MKKIKALHIITRLDPGGSSTNTLDTIKHIDTNIFDVTLISGKTYDPDGSIRNKLYNDKIDTIFINELQREIDPIKDIIAYQKIKKHIAIEKYDIVHTHCSKAGILGRWAAYHAGVNKIIHTPHGHVFYNYFSKIKTKLFIAVEQMTARITHSIITLTELGKKEHLDLNIGREQQYAVIPSGIDFKKLTTAKHSNRFGAEFVFGSVTRLDPIKGSHVLIQAFAELQKSHPNTKLVLVGCGKDEKDLIKMTQILNIEDRVTFTGYQSNPYNFTAQFDAFVMPSLNEGMGRSILEALRMNKPVIASRIGGIPEFIKHDHNGLLVKPGDVQSLASAMKRLLEENDLKNKLTNNIDDQLFDHYSLDNMITRIEKLYLSSMTKNKQNTEEISWTN